MTGAGSILTRLGCLLLLFLTAGCGAHAGQNEKCSLQLALIVAPSVTTVDHSLSAPGNSQQFTAFFNYTSVPPGCPVPLLSLKADVAWSLSDSSNASISNAQDTTNGVATCTGTSASPITVSAGSVANSTQGPGQTATASLMCK